MTHLLDLTPEEAGAAMTALGEPAYRARQVFRWVYDRGVCDYAEMTDLPAALRPRLAEALPVLAGHVVRRRDASDGVVKLLIEWSDGESVETVLIPEANRATACLSTQVGCAVGCGFCATGAVGVRRNLSGGEILEQVLHLQLAGERRVTNAVFMGMGEPLANYDATVGAVRGLIDPERFGISARRVTVSTVGLPRQIRRLAGEDLPVTLAISLHAPNDELRRELIPTAGRTPIRDVLAAARAFYAARKREVTLEYVLLGGVNDTPTCAEQLAEIAHQLRCNVNLIRYNPVAPLPYRRPSEQTVRRFLQRLTERGVNAHVRRPRGLDADAACGQLRGPGASKGPGKQPPA